MKIIPTHRLMNLLVFVALALPLQVAGGGLRGLLAERPSALQPLQPPPATADLTLAQLDLDAFAPAPAAAAPGAASPGPALAPPAPAPAPIPAAPTKFAPAKITEATCKALTGEVSKLIGVPGAGGPGPAPAPAAALLQEPEPGMAPHVECKIYAWVSKKPAGCNCFIQEPPPPAKPAKMGGCPKLPNALAMGFTGDVVQLGPLGFGGQTGAWKSTTCIYRQWFFDPNLEGHAKDYARELAEGRTEKWIKDTYAAALKNAHNTAKGFYALTPVPWFKLYPTTAPPPAAAPAPAPAGPAGPTTPPILHFDPPTTMAPYMFTTPPAFGAAIPGFTTAPTYVAVR